MLSAVGNIAVYFVFFLPFSAVGERRSRSRIAGRGVFRREMSTLIKTTLKEAACCGLALQMKTP